MKEQANTQTSPGIEEEEHPKGIDLPDIYGGDHSVRKIYKEGSGTFYGGGGAGGHNVATSPVRPIQKATPQRRPQAPVAKPQAPVAKPSAPPLPVKKPVGDGGIQQGQAQSDQFQKTEPTSSAPVQHHNPNVAGSGPSTPSIKPVVAGAGTSQVQQAAGVLGTLAGGGANLGARLGHLARSATNTGGPTPVAPRTPAQIPSSTAQDVTSDPITGKSPLPPPTTGGLQGAWKRATGRPGIKLPEGYGGDYSVRKIYMEDRAGVRRLGPDGLYLDEPFPEQEPDADKSK